MVLLQNILEAANFVKFFTASLAALSTPHLYISALATWSNHSFISQAWKKHFPLIPSLTYVSNMTTPLMTIQTLNFIYSVAFSNDGIHIVSSSDDTSTVFDWSHVQINVVLAIITQEVNGFSKNKISCIQ